MQPSPSDSKRPRRHKTRWRVLLADRLSRLFITVSGIGTILAVLGVFFFLAAVVVLLFLPASIQSEQDVSLPLPAAQAAETFKDPRRLLAWSLADDGTLIVTRIGDDRVLEKRNLFTGGPRPTVHTPPLERVDSNNQPFWDIAFGFDNGTARMVNLRFDARALLPNELKALAQDVPELALGFARPMNNGLLLRDGVETYLHLTVKTEVQPPVRSMSTEAVKSLALAFGAKGPHLALLTKDEQLSLIVTEVSQFGGTKQGRYALPYELPQGRKQPDRIRLANAGDQVYLLWNDGFYQRIDAATPKSASVAGTGYVFGKDRAGLSQLRHTTIVTDEDQRLAWTIEPEGLLTVFRLDNGELLERRSLFDNGPPLTASSQPVDRAEQVSGQKESYKEISFGFLDGSFRLGKLRIKSTVLDPSVLTEEIRRLREGEVKRLGSGLVVRTPLGQYRLDEFQIDLQTPVPALKPDPIRLIDHAVTRNQSIACILTESGELRRDEVQLKMNMLTKVVTVKRLDVTELPFKPRESGVVPRTLLLNASGDSLYLVWRDGHFQRLAMRSGVPPEKVESGDLLAGRDTHITALWQMLGRQTMLVGDSGGRLKAWFPVSSARSSTKDGFATVCGHDFQGPEAAVTAIGGTSRSRLIAVGHENGAVRALQVTSEKELADLSLGGDQPVTLVGVAPKEDGILAMSGQQGRLWRMDPKHPEISVKSLFFPVWYEGSEKPRHHWESSSGDDAFEPKYGVVPLIFGTLKASFYSLLFGVPLALLAAIYTSEFMRPRARAFVKPAIEMMASLPSVVLGFLAGLVFAQFIENVVPAVLAAFVLVPFFLVAFAHLFQLLPDKVGRRLSQMRVPFFLVAIACGLTTAALLGPFVERLLFAGNFRSWLSDDRVGMAGGWFLLFLPISIFLSVFLMSSYITPWLRGISSHWDRPRVAGADALRFLMGCGLAVMLALSLSHVMEYFGSNPRGLFLGTFQQRNALVVGFVMGFAIIPIIFTIADDALTSVPDHLRSGSLATGATQWQTAVRIVIPTAMSGLFSAVMIGMGRAVGETMIVVMATGNTPVMEWNMFNGFRTLSANIAVELPEAPANSTHFRTLFLAALILFIMTFILNTIAELVRLRFRKRAYQL